MTKSVIEEESELSVLKLADND